MKESEVEVAGTRSLDLFRGHKSPYVRIWVSGPSLKSLDNSGTPTQYSLRESGRVPTGISRVVKVPTPEHRKVPWVNEKLVK